MSGYSGYSKSNRAIYAEQDERFPLSIAKRVLAKKIGWTQAKAKAFLISIGTSEWHHCSKFYNAVDYYDVSDDWIKFRKEDLEPVAILGPF